MRLSAYDGLDLPGNLWTPELCIVNHLSGPDEGSSFPTQFLGPPTNCRLKKCSKYKTTVRNPFDNLVSFPFDLDQISAEFYNESDFRLNDGSASGFSTGARTYQLALLKDGDSEGKPVRLHVWNGEVNEWDILAVSMELNESPADERGSEGTYFNIELHASRKSMYYVWKAILPLHLLSVLSFTGMALDVDDYASRAGLLATFLLAALVMLFVIGDYLPRTDFLTNIDLGHDNLGGDDCCVARCVDRAQHYGRFLEHGCPPPIQSIQHVHSSNRIPAGKCCNCSYSQLQKKEGHSRIVRERAEENGSTVKPSGRTIFT